MLEANFFSLQRAKSVAKLELLDTSIEFCIKNKILYTDIPHSDCKRLLLLSRKLLKVFSLIVNSKAFQVFTKHESNFIVHWFEKGMQENEILWSESQLVIASCERLAAKVRKRLLFSA